MNADDLDAVIAQMWLTFAPLARSRVEALEAYVDALADGSGAAALRPDAASAAHKLAGALGTYGRRGSDEASQLEVLLHADAPAPDAEQLRPLVAVLRASVDA